MQQSDTWRPVVQPPSPKPKARLDWLWGLAAAERWTLAAAILLAAANVWFETTAPDHPTPPFLAAVVVATLACGAAPGFAVGVAGGLAAWGFSAPGGGKGLVAYALLAVVGLVVGRILRSRLRRGEPPRDD